MIKTPEQYVASLRDGRVVYQDGERVYDVPSYPVYRRAVESAATEYMLAMQPEYRQLFNVVEDREEYPFVYHAPRTGEDLQRRRLIIQTLNRLGVRSVKFTGIDSLNGIALATRQIDAALGTNYSQRIDSYRKWCQQNDPGLCATMSDPKGHRGLHAEDPRQKHKDFYLRIADRTSDGIIIAGCKVHISHGIFANELLCLPSRNHDEAGKDYAVACAVPCHAKGVTFIGTAGTFGQPGEHPMVIFDNVFVPWERVFLSGEWQFSRLVTTSFGCYHRLSADTYKYVHLQSLAGLAMLMAEYNGLTHAPRIQDMLAWLAMYAELTEALGQAAALNTTVDPLSGLVVPNEVWSNCAKYWFADNWLQAVKYLQDITGGISATMPSLKDWENPETRPYMEKYLGGDAKYPTEDRIRAIDMVNQLSSAFQGTLSIHAEGSLASQRMMVYRQADWERYKAAARHSTGLSTDHPDYKDLPFGPLYKLPS